MANAISNARFAALHKDIKNLLNKHSIENDSDTPDFILADYLIMCLMSFGQTTRMRTSWWIEKDK